MDENKERLNIANALAEGYERYGNNLWQKILSQAEEDKKSGKISDRDLDNFYNAVAPMTDLIRRKRLKDIIAKLKAL